MEGKQFIEIVKAIRADDKLMDKAYDKLKPILSESLMEVVAEKQYHLQNTIIGQIQDYFNDGFPSVLEEELLTDSDPERLYFKLLNKMRNEKANQSLLQK